MTQVGNVKTVSVRIQKSKYVFFNVECVKRSSGGSIMVQDAESKVVVMFAYYTPEKDWFFIDSRSKEIFYFEDILKAKIERAFKIKFM